MSLSPEEKRVVDAIYRYAAERMKLGVSSYSIQKELVEKGLTQQQAEAVTQNLQRAWSEAKRNAATRSMAVGALFFFGGIVITVGTYMSASPGESYVITWGAILFGGLQFLRGLFQMGE